MKKILSLTLVIVMLLTCLTSCFQSIDNYAKKLEEAGYEVEIVEEEDIEDYAEDMGLDADKASVESMLYAMKSGLIPKVILVIECVSTEAAEEMAGAAEVVDKLSILGLSMEIDGKFVLVGSTSAVEEAMA